MSVCGAIIDEDYQAGGIALHNPLDAPIGADQGCFAVPGGGTHSGDRLAYLDQHAFQCLIVFLGVCVVQRRVQLDCRGQQVVGAEYLEIGHVLDLEEGLA